MFEKADLLSFFHLRKELPVIDVRSPCEYIKGHIPGSINIPLFSDEERAAIGTLYKEEGQDEAILLGESYANPKIDWYLSKVREQSDSKHLLVYCFRGGLRSSRFCSLLESKGWKPSKLTGGYKSYRRSVKALFSGNLPLLILGGRTGSGKTEVLWELDKRGEQVIDLEGLANHRGSAFGNIGLDEQPTTEQFENNLYEKFLLIGDQKPIWLEDESAGIGRIFLPEELYKTMRRSPMLVMEIPRSIRVERLCAEYSGCGSAPLVKGVLKITKRLGGERSARAISAIQDGKLSEGASIILEYYDKCYDYGMNRDRQRILKVLKLETGNPDKAAEELLKLKDSLSL